MISERDKRKLLIPGWAGEINKEEYNYIRQSLISNKPLRTLWGFIRGKGYQLSEREITARAMLPKEV